MRATDYFMTHVMRKRPYLKETWIEQAAANPLKRAAQPDGRIRAWTRVAEVGKYLRVVWLADVVTVHNAFWDRRFKGDKT